MSDLNEIREELDLVSNRVNLLEYRTTQTSNNATDALTVARMADRKLSKLRADLQLDPDGATDQPDSP